MQKIAIAGTLVFSTFPILSAAAISQKSDDVSVKINIGSTIAINIAAKQTSIKMSPNQIKHGTDADGLKHIINVTTNSLTGYSLSVKDEDENTSLVSGSAAIDARAGTLAPGTAPGWNYSCSTAVSNLTSASAPVCDPAATSAAITSENIPVAANQNNNKSAISDNITIIYDVATSSEQLEGTYVDTIIYTASAN